LKVVELLIQYSVEVNLAERQQWTPLHVAAGSGYVEIVDMLLQAGADVDCRAADGTTCLYLAAYSGHKDVVVRLLADGAKVILRRETSIPIFFYSEIFSKDHVRPRSL
jgi:ankyrin repeat protein